MKWPAPPENDAAIQTPICLGMAFWGLAQHGVLAPKSFLTANGRIVSGSSVFLVTASFSGANGRIILGAIGRGNPKKNFKTEALCQNFV